MALEYARIEGKSRSYRNLLVALGIVLAIFLVSYFVAYLRGFRVWGINNQVIWGQLITLDIYFIGLSAGAIVVSSLGYVFNREEYKPIGRVAVYLGLLLMIGAMVCVLTDLGRPEKFWRLFMFFYLNNMTSMFAINGIFYMGYIGLMLVYLWLVMEGKMRLAVIIGTIDVLWAILVHTGTGAIFGLVGTREILTSPIKPFEFVAAALTSGTALLILVSHFTFKFARRKLDERIIPGLAKLLAIIIIVLAIMVFFDKLTHVYFPERGATVFLFSGPYWWLFWVFQIGLGIVVPLIILVHPRAGKTRRGILLAAASVVIGVLGERAALVIPGMAQVQQLYPGEIQGIWGASGSFTITFWESTMSLGVLALVAMLFVLGLKYLEILPAEPVPVAAAAAPTPAEEGTKAGGEPSPEPPAEEETKADTGGAEAAEAPLDEDTEAPQEAADAGTEDTEEK